VSPEHPKPELTDGKVIEVVFEKGPILAWLFTILEVR